jgi:hypothetical protein
MTRALFILALAGFAYAAMPSQAAHASPLIPAQGVTLLPDAVTNVAWRRCWRDRWGRLHCRTCWRDRWGRVRCR